MIKETFTYKNYNGEEVTQTCYFDLSEAEISEMELSVHGGYAEMIEAAANTQDQPTLWKIFKDMVLRAYGEKSPDGMHFMKSEKISDAFRCTKAFSLIVMRLTRDADYAAKFIKGIVPEGAGKAAVESKAAELGLN